MVPHFMTPSFAMWNKRKHAHGATGYKKKKPTVLVKRHGTCRYAVLRTLGMYIFVKCGVKKYMDVPCSTKLASALNLLVCISPTF